MKRSTKGLLLLGGASLFYSAGALVAPPWADAHTSAAAFTNVHCLPSGAWATDLTISGTDADKNPTADINTPGGPITGAPVPYHHTFMAQAVTPTYTVTVVVKWNDGVTQNLGSFTANRPDGCTPPTTEAGTTTTTTCAMAIPPRTDCGGTTTSTPTIQPTSSLPSQPPSSATVDGGPSSVPVVKSGETPTSTSRTTIPNVYLPTTGVDGANVLVGVALGLLFAGVVLVLVKRKNKP